MRSTLFATAVARPCSALLLPRLLHLPAMRTVTMDATPAALRTLQPPALRAPLVRMMSFGDKTVVDTCKGKITDALNPTELKIQGAFDDPNGSHITIYCVADAFEGLRSMKRQQMVYKAIWEEMQDGGPLHAVDSMTLMAPSEVKKE